MEGKKLPMRDEKEQKIQHSMSTQVTTLLGRFFALPFQLIALRKSQVLQLRVSSTSINTQDPDEEAFVAESSSAYATSDYLTPNYH